MALAHRDWQARRHRTLNHFDVHGVITNPAMPLADGGFWVTTRTPLRKLDHQPLLPSMLILRLYVEQERHYPYAPPAQPLSHPAHY